MNNEAEAMQQFVVWLLQTLDPANGTPSGDWNQATEPGQTGSVNLQFSAEPLGSVGEAGILDNVADSANPASQPIAKPQDLSMPLDEEPLQLAFGDIPAVQHRFHALLKHRLKTEIERNPPRFPWETEQHDYQYDYESYAESEQPYDEGIMSCPVCEPASLWAAHLKTFNLPIALPDSVLQALFHQCRHLVQSSLRDGRRLVQAVESLFPGEGATLDNLAGLVLTSPVRSGTASLSRPTASNPNLPTDYHQASRPQQMVLSLLAARQMLEAMTLTLSPDNSLIQRSWLTDAGVMTLEAQYEPELRKVQVKVQLPMGGTVQLQQGDLESIASSTQAGSLSVSLSPFTPEGKLICTAAEQAATLTVELAEADMPLIFAVRLMLEP